MTDQHSEHKATTSRQPVPEDAIGDRIKEARESRGWTQMILSNRTKMADPNNEGISRTVLVGYESGKTKPGARELRILSEALNVTPSWLLLGDTAPARVIMPSLEYLEGNNELEKALRIALAMLLLKPHERSLLGMMLFSLAGRALGDVALGGLMISSNMIAKGLLKELEADYPELAEACTNAEALSQLVRRLGEGMESNYGNKLRGNDEETWEGEWLYRPTPADKP